MTSYKDVSEGIRFYASSTPAVGDVLFVRVTQLCDSYVSCSSVEYPEMNGMLLLSELSRRRIRSLSQLVRIGSELAVVVLRVSGTNMDVSKCKVSASEVAAAETRFVMMKSLRTLLYKYSIASKTNFKELIERIAHAFTGSIHSLPTTQEEQEFLTSNWTSSSSVVVKAVLLLTYFGPEGVEALREVAHNCPSNCTLQYLSAPRYILSTTAASLQDGKQILLDAIGTMKTLLESKGGKLEIEKEPYITTPETDILATLEKESDDEVEEEDSEADE